MNEGYRNIGKKVLLGMQWAHEHLRFKYLLKTDDDAFVCLSKLFSELQRHDMTERMYYGATRVSLSFGSPQPSARLLLVACAIDARTNAFSFAHQASSRTTQCRSSRIRMIRWRTQGAF